MDEEQNGDTTATEDAVDEAIDTTAPKEESHTKYAGIDPFADGQIRTLDGDIAGDVYEADAINYQVLLGKIDELLERLKLDA